MSLSLRLKDLLGPVTRVKKKKKKTREVAAPPERNLAFIRIATQLNKNHARVQKVVDRFQTACGSGIDV